MKRTIAAIVLLLGTITMLGSTAAQAATSPIVIHEIYYNSPGKDTGANASLNAEWVQLHSNSGHSVRIA